MPPRGGDVPYNPVPSVAPSTQAPNDYIRTEATPSSFGGQIGQAMQGAGQAAEKLGTQAIDLADQQQGLINQSLAENAVTQHTEDVDNISAKYRSLEGLDAVQAHDQAIADIQAARQRVSASLPNAGAQRLFNSLALRHEAYALGDVSSYYAKSVKDASLKASTSGMATSLNQTGLPQVAQDDQRFSFNLTTAVLHLNDTMKNQGYGSGMNVDKTGKASWDTSTPEGQQAQNVYNEKYDQIVSKAWENRIKTLADDPTTGNARAALDVFNANKDKIPAQAQMELQAYLQPKVRMMDAHGIAGDSLATADKGYNASVTAAVSGQASNAAGSVSRDAVSKSIRIQEGPGTSVQGAVAGIMPATFQQYAKPGESINNPADRQAVHDRIISDLWQKAGGDPARVAVGYFSGPGNMAPPGSPTPWINDTKDANGKSTSSYVSDVLGRAGVQGGAMSKADYYRAHEAEIVEDARRKADQLHPDDPQIADLAAARTSQQLNAVIRQQDLAYHADNDLVFRAVNGDLSKGTAPVTVDQLRATSPEVAAAWDRMQYQQPKEAREIATRLITENAKSNGGHDANTYGAGFYDVFNRIHAPDGSPNRITDPSQLYSMVGQPGGLTIAGLAKAREEIMGRRTPDGEAESAMRAQMFRNVHGMLTGTNDGLGIKDPKGEEIYLKFMAAAYPAIEAAKSAGKSPYQLFDPNSPDYIGKIAAGMKRSPAAYQADMIASLDDASKAAPTKQVKASVEEIRAEMMRRGLLKAEGAAPPPAKVNEGPQVPTNG